MNTQQTERSGKTEITPQTTQPAERAEEFLRYASDWEPSHPIPANLIAATLAGERARRNRWANLFRPAVIWRVGPVAGGVLAALVFVHLRANVPEPAAIPAAAHPVSATQNQPADTAANIEHAQSVTPPALRQTESVAAAPLNTTVASLHRRATGRLLRPVPETIAEQPGFHPPDVRPLRQPLPEHSTVRPSLAGTRPANAAEPLALPPNAIPLDDDAGTVYVPVVLSENAPDGSGLKLTPAVLAVPPGSDDPGALHSVE